MNKGFWQRISGRYAFTWQWMLIMFLLSVPLTASIYGRLGTFEFNQAFLIASVAQLLSMVPILIFGRSVVATERYSTRLAMVLSLLFMTNIVRAFANGTLFSLWGIDDTKFIGRIFSNVGFGMPIMIAIAWLMDQYMESRQSIQSLKDVCHEVNTRVSGLVVSLGETYSFWRRELKLETTESQAALSLLSELGDTSSEQSEIAGQIEKAVASAENSAHLYWSNGVGLEADEPKLPRKYELREVINEATRYRPVAPRMSAFGLFAVLAAWHTFVISRREGLIVSALVGVATYLFLVAYRRFLLPIQVRQSAGVRLIIFEGAALVLTFMVWIIMATASAPRGHKLLDSNSQLYLVLTLLNVIALYGGFMESSVSYIHRLTNYIVEREQVATELANELDLQNSLSKRLFTRGISRTPTAGTIRLQEAIASRDSQRLTEALRESLEIWKDCATKLARQ